MPDKEYYIMLSMIETIDTLVRRNAVKAGEDWDPLGADCGSNKSNLFCYTSTDTPESTLIIY